ncbi:uncharacterized protein LOC133523707 [Cydia pomonella]|uniref:uncharacterized protein LOC133523707 n=1 Tax=Cydia pomonella TaxID=82600 RepID=UPI002ADE94AB|nr:uncharacterized protein LOC133523707 [Cydia pomonella]
MAKISVGVLSIFNHETHDWIIYKDRLEQWFVANDIAGETAEDKSASAKRRAILLSSLAECTYKLLRDLALPKELGNLNYADVVLLLDGHFKPKICGFAERNSFYSAVQSANETFSDWAARVRGLALHCGFSASTLDDTLRDRFVLGMVQGPERDKLFTEAMSSLTFSSALQTAENVRSARKGARAGATGASGSSAADNELGVHKMAASRAPASAGARPTGSTGASCTICGYRGHSASDCRFANSICDKCGSKGHLKRVCRKKFPNKKINFVECCLDSGDEEGLAD